MRITTFIKVFTMAGTTRSAAVLLFVGALLLLTGCSKESKIARHITRADEFYAAGDYDKARLEYLNVVQLDPRNVHAIGQLGNIFFENGVVLQAGAALEQALKLGATDPRIRARLGTLLAASKRFDQAREHALKALESDPTNEESLLLLADLVGSEAAAGDLVALLGRLRSQHGNLPVYDTAEAIVLLKRKELAAALALAEKAVSNDPKSAAAQFVVAGILFAQTNQVAGEAALARAAELSPPRSTRQIQYVNYLIQRGATNEARTQLDQIIKAAPDFVPGRLRKAQWLFAGQNYEDVDGEIAAVLTRDPSSVEARLLEAQLHLARREPARADEVMTELIRQFPNSEQLQYQAAVTSLANQKSTDAQLRLDRAYVLNPNIPEVVLLRGRLYLARGQAGEVIASTQRLIATNAMNRPAYLLLGDALVANGELDRAIGLFRDYERRFTNDPAGPQSLGMLYLRKTDATQARQAFERAVKSREDYLPAIEQLVRLDLATTNNAAALARARGFVERQPDVAEGRVLLAQVYLSNRQPQLAEPELEQAIATKPALQSAYLLLAQLYNESSRRDEAIQQLHALLEKQPGEQRALMVLGILHTSAGDYRKAAESYETLLKTNPAFSPALNNLAYLYSEKLDNLGRAYDLARKSRELQPDDPRIADTLGWILFRRGEYALALVHLEESASRLTREGEVLYHLGMAHYAMAHEQPARAAFELAVKLEPAAAWRSEVDQCLAVLDSNPATSPGELKRLEELANSRRDDVIALLRLAEAQEAAGRLGEAFATFRRASSINSQAVAPLIGQARVTVASGDPAAGLSLARKARDLVKKESAALYELAVIAYGARDFSWSFSLFQEAMGDLRNNPQAQFDFAQSAIAVGRLDVAKSALEQASSAGLGNARIDLQLKLIPSAMAGTLVPVPAQVAESLSTAAPGELLADYMKARQLADAGTSDNAVRLLGSILQSFPQFTPARRSLAVVLSKSPGTLGQAEKLAREVRETQPNDAEMARVLGVSAYARGDFRFAAEMLQEASRSLSTDGELFILLGRARLETKQFADARQALDKALALPLSEPLRQQARLTLEQLNNR